MIQGSILDNIPKKNNYFVRLFKGEISLPMTYWVWFFFLNFVITICVDFYFSSLPLEPNNIQKNVILAITFFLILYTIFILIAVWRSATNHDGSKFWAIVAKIIVVINFIILFSETFKFCKVFFDKEHSISNSIKQLDRRTPLKINDNVYVTKAIIDGKSIYYTYMLKNVEKNSISRFNTSLLRDDVIKASCSNEKTIAILKEGYKFKYYYTNKNNKKVAEIDIRNEDCIKLNEDKNILKAILSKESN